MSKNKSELLHDQGQAVWYDNIERRLIINGELKRMIDDGQIYGITSNPSIFENAIANSADYDQQLASLASEINDPQEIFLHLAIQDIQQAADLLMPLYQKSNALDGYISLEVNPDLAHETEATTAEVKRLWEWVKKPNLMVKIPATEAGLPAIRDSIAEGINVNVTLIFSRERYKKVMDAYLSGLEIRSQSGKPVHNIASVASFFVSRMDSNVDKKLEAIGTSEANKLAGKSAIANARLAYQEYKEFFTSDRFLRLSAQGARIQRPLWASTSTKNPHYPDTLYVDELVAPNTVNTVPQQTLEALLDHARTDIVIDDYIQEDERVMTDLKKVGVDIDQVTQELEDEGVRKFADSYHSLLSTIEEKITK